jgi:hypothetical protein
MCEVKRLETTRDAHGVQPLIHYTCTLTLSSLFISEMDAKNGLSQGKNITYLKDLAAQRSVHTCSVDKVDLLQVLATT